jgi:hypothetical protein
VWQVSCHGSPITQAVSTPLRPRIRYYIALPGMLVVDSESRQFTGKIRVVFDNVAPNGPIIAGSMYLATGMEEVDGSLGRQVGADAAEYLEGQLAEGRGRHSEWRG